MVSKLRIICSSEVTVSSSVQNNFLTANFQESEVGITNSLGKPSAVEVFYHVTSRVRIIEV